MPCRYSAVVARFGSLMPFSLVRDGPFAAAFRAFAAACAARLVRVLFVGPTPVGVSAGASGLGGVLPPGAAGRALASLPALRRLRSVLGGVAGSQGASAAPVRYGAVSSFTPQAAFAPVRLAAALFWSSASFAAVAVLFAAGCAVRSSPGAFVGPTCAAPAARCGASLSSWCSSVLPGSVRSPVFGNRRPAAATSCLFVLL
jgi:hypothetical protein